jgi:type I restriction enzyme S subunit
MSAGTKPGYKQTEVGVIPEDWDVTTVGREFEIKLGKMLDAEKNVGIPKPYLGNRSVQWDRIDISHLPTVPMSRTDLERFRLRSGDLLVCEGGEFGLFCLSRNDNLGYCVSNTASDTEAA